MQTKQPKTAFITILTVGSTMLAYASLLLIYVYSVYEAYILNGFWKSLIVMIPVLGQILWAGVKFYSNGFFSTYYYLIYAFLLLAGFAQLLSALLSKNDRDNSN